jgi:hypothetical protein
MTQTLYAHMNIIKKETKKNLGCEIMGWGDVRNHGV